MSSNWPDTFLIDSEPIDIVEWAESNIVLTKETAGKGAGPLKIRPHQVEPLRVAQERSCRRMTWLIQC